MPLTNTEPPPADVFLDFIEAGLRLCMEYDHLFTDDQDSPTRS